MPKGGPRQGAGRKPIGERITFDLSTADKTLLDQKRGKFSRSAYIRQLVQKDVMMNTATQFDFSAILEEFLNSPDFGEGCKAATRASWGGSGCSVELFVDGTWRVLWNNEIGNRYNSPGEIISLPALDDSCYQECVNGENPMSEEDYFDLAFANEEEELKQGMRDKLAGIA
jgi:hypothetical protein